MNLAGLVVNLFCVYFVYTDCKKTNKNQWVWSALVLVFGLLPLGIYLLKTGRKGWGIAWTIIGVLLYLFIILMFVALAHAGMTMQG